MRETLLCLALLASGCCNDGEPCPQNAVFVLVSTDGASVADVTIEGYDFVCTEESTATVCRTETIADGSYDLFVDVAGIPVQWLTLVVRTNPIPEYSCDCEIPAGSATVEIPSASDPDAGI